MSRAASDLAAQWTLDPSVTYLNHGAFGACPRVVLEEQAEWRARLEREPVRFYIGELEARLDEVRARVGELVGADPADVVFCANATTGVNTVLASIPFEAGDEVLVTDHGYPACLNAAGYWTARAGASVATAHVPFPLAGEDDVVRAVLEKVSPRTRLAVLDHVTSPTGMVFPIERLVKELSHRGIDTLVDGAHAPGMLPLAVGALGAAFYTGNFHKWCCAPKSCAFLWVRRDLHNSTRPLVISHGASEMRTDRPRFLLEFDWAGTSDVTALLSVPAALRFLRGLYPGGLPELQAKNRSLALEARSTIARALGTAPPCPDAMIGSLAAILFPDATPSSPSPTELHERLERRAIQVPIVAWPRRASGFVRVAAQAYNHIGQYEKLAEALRVELGLDEARRA
jgi:isopenicillin-N epimerase